MREIRVRFQRDERLEHIDVQVSAAERDAQVNALLTRISGDTPVLLNVVCEDGARCKLNAADIVTVSVTGKQTRLVTENSEYTLRQTLQSLESALDGRRFVRISRFELVNVDKIRKYDFTLAGTLRLELAGGVETWASRRCIPAIRRRLNEREKEESEVPTEPEREEN